MKLFLISQDENANWDTYDSAVVAAPDASTAQLMNPNGEGLMEDEDWTSDWSAWCFSPEAVTVHYLGEATDGTEQGVICASFNAG